MLEPTVNSTMLQSSAQRESEVANMLLRGHIRKPKHYKVAIDADAREMVEQFKDKLLNRKRYVEQRGFFREWYANRSGSTKAALSQGNPFGEEAASTRYKLFLKTQIKVKPDLEKTYEESYGQPVQACSAEYNLAYADISHALLTILSRCANDNVTFKLGYSEEEFLRRYKEQMEGVDSKRFTAYDIRAQDSSYNATVVRALRYLLEDIGIPSEQCVLYEEMRKKWDYFSMSEGGVSGTLEYALASGEPLTIHSNCTESGLLYMDRFIHNGASRLFIVGDNITTNSERRRKEQWRSLRNIQLAIESSGYFAFAGYVGTSEELSPDPVKAMLKLGARRRVPDGGLVMMWQAMHDRQPRLSHDGQDDIMCMLEQEYKSIDPGFVQSASSRYAKMSRSFGEFMKGVDKEHPFVRRYYMSPNDQCFRRCLRAMYPQSWNEKVSARPTMAEIVALKERHPEWKIRIHSGLFKEELLCAEYGIQVFKDHAVCLFKNPKNRT